MGNANANNTIRWRHTKSLT